MFSDSKVTMPHLPDDILINIFFYIKNMRDLCHLGAVNKDFRVVIHYLAVRQLRQKMLSVRVPRQVLENFGWTEDYHEHDHPEELAADGCSCVDIAFGYKAIMPYKVCIRKPGL